jgi:hypothetical protein
MPAAGATGIAECKIFAIFTNKMLVIHEKDVPLQRINRQKRYQMEKRQ